MAAETDGQARNPTSDSGIVGQVIVFRIEADVFVVEVLRSRPENEAEKGLTHEISYIHGATGTEWIRIDEAKFTLNDEFGHDNVPFKIADSALDNASPKGRGGRGRTSGGRGRSKKEPFQCQVVSDKKVGILAEPNVELSAKKHLPPGSVFDASKTKKTADGRLYYCLADGRGWVPECSRKDPSKVVIKPVQPLNPEPAVEEQPVDESVVEKVPPPETKEGDRVDSVMGGDVDVARSEADLTSGQKSEPNKVERGSGKNQQKKKSAVTVGDNVVVGARYGLVTLDLRPAHQFLMVQWLDAAEGEEDATVHFKEIKEIVTTEQIAARQLAKAEEEEKKKNEEETQKKAAEKATAETPTGKGRGKKKNSAGGRDEDANADMEGHDEETAETPKGRGAKRKTTSSGRGRGAGKGDNGQPAVVDQSAAGDANADAEGDLDEDAPLVKMPKKAAVPKDPFPADLLPADKEVQYNALLTVSLPELRKMLKDVNLPTVGEKRDLSIRIIRELLEMPPTDADKSLIETHEKEEREKAENKQKAKGQKANAKAKAKGQGRFLRPGSNLEEEESGGEEDKQGLRKAELRTFVMAFINNSDLETTRLRDLNEALDLQFGELPPKVHIRARRIAEKALEARMALLKEGQQEGEDEDMVPKEEDPDSNKENSQDGAANDDDERDQADDQDDEESKKERIGMRELRTMVKEFIQDKDLEGVRLRDLNQAIETKVGPLSEKTVGRIERVARKVIFEKLEKDTKKKEEQEAQKAREQERTQLEQERKAKADRIKAEEAERFALIQAARKTESYEELPQPEQAQNASDDSDNDDSDDDSSSDSDSDSDSDSSTSSTSADEDDGGSPMDDVPDIAPEKTLSKAEAIKVLHSELFGDFDSDEEPELKNLKKESKKKEKVVDLAANEKAEKHKKKKADKIAKRKLKKEKKHQRKKEKKERKKEKARAKKDAAQKIRDGEKDKFKKERELRKAQEAELKLERRKSREDLAEAEKRRKLADEKSAGSKTNLVARMNFKTVQGTLLGDLFGSGVSASGQHQPLGATATEKGETKKVVMRSTAEEALRRVQKMEEKQRLKEKQRKESEELIMLERVRNKIKTWVQDCLVDGDRRKKMLEKGVLRTLLQAPTTKSFGGKMKQLAAGYGAEVVITKRTAARRVSIAEVPNASETNEQDVKINEKDAAAGPPAAIKTAEAKENEKQEANGVVTEPSTLEKPTDETMAEGDNAAGLRRSDSVSNNVVELTAAQADSNAMEIDTPAAEGGVAAPTEDQADEDLDEFFAELDAQPAAAEQAEFAKLDAQPEAAEQAEVAKPMEVDTTNEGKAQTATDEALRAGKAQTATDEAAPIEAEVPKSVEAEAAPIEAEVPKHIEAEVDSVPAVVSGETVPQLARQTDAVTEEATPLLSAAENPLSVKPLEVDAGVVPSQEAPGNKASDANEGKPSPEVVVRAPAVAEQPIEKWLISFDVSAFQSFCIRHPEAIEPPVPPMKKWIDSYVKSVDNFAETKRKDMRMALSKQFGSVRPELLKRAEVWASIAIQALSTEKKDQKNTIKKPKKNEGQPERKQQMTVSKTVDESDVAKIENITDVEWAVAMLVPWGFRTGVDANEPLLRPPTSVAMQILAGFEKFEYNAVFREAMKKTQLGKAMSSLRHHPNAEVAKIARTYISVWKNAIAREKAIEQSRIDEALRNSGASPTAEAPSTEQPAASAVAIAD